MPDQAQKVFFDSNPGIGSGYSLIALAQKLPATAEVSLNVWLMPREKSADSSQPQCSDFVVFAQGDSNTAKVVLDRLQVILFENFGLKGTVVSKEKGNYRLVIEPSLSDGIPAHPLEPIPSVEMACGEFIESLHDGIKILAEGKLSPERLIERETTQVQRTAELEATQVRESVERAFSKEQVPIIMGILDKLKSIAEKSTRSKSVPGVNL